MGESGERICANCKRTRCGADPEHDQRYVSFKSSIECKKHAALLPVDDGEEQAEESGVEHASHKARRAYRRPKTQWWENIEE